MCERYNMHSSCEPMSAYIHICISVLLVYMSYVSVYININRIIKKPFNNILYYTNQRVSNNFHSNVANFNFDLYVNIGTSVRRNQLVERFFFFVQHSGNKNSGFEFTR